MPAAYIEHRPRSTSAIAEVTHYVIVVNETEVGSYKTQKEAKDAACRMAYRPVHVARVRHEQNRDIPDHWRKDPC